MAATYTVGTTKTYGTIQAAIDAIPGNLSGQGIQTVEVYAGGASNIYTEMVDAYTGFSAATAANYIHLLSMLATGGKSQDAGGTGILIGNGFTNGVNNDFLLRMYNYGIVEGFEIGKASNAVPGTRVCRGVLAYSNSVVKKCIVHDIIGGGYVIGIYPIDGKVYNSIIYNIVTVGTTTYAAGILNATTLSAFNNSIRNVTAGGATIGHGIRCLTNTASVIVKNNYCGSCDNDFTFQTLNVRNYNISSDATATGANSLTSKSAANQFVDLTGGSEDFSLKAGADCIAAGIAAGQLSASDIIGTAWNDPPSVGAFEVLVEGGGASRIIDIGSSIHVGRTMLNPTGSGSIFVKKKSGIYVPDKRIRKAA